MLFFSNFFFSYSVVVVLFFFIKYLSDFFFFFFSSRRRHTRSKRDWSSDVCSSDLRAPELPRRAHQHARHALAAELRLSAQGGPAAGHELPVGLAKPRCRDHPVRGPARPVGVAGTVERLEHAFRKARRLLEHRARQLIRIVGEQRMCAQAARAQQLLEHEAHFAQRRSVHRRFPRCCPRLERRRKVSSAAGTASVAGPPPPIGGRPPRGALQVHAPARAAPAPGRCSRPGNPRTAAPADRTRAPWDTRHTRPPQPARPTRTAPASGARWPVPGDTGTQATTRCP